MCCNLILFFIFLEKPNGSVILPKLISLPDLIFLCEIITINFRSRLYYEHWTDKLKHFYVNLLFFKNHLFSIVSIFFIKHIDFCWLFSMLFNFSYLLFSLISDCFYQFLKCFPKICKIRLF